MAKYAGSVAVLAALVLAGCSQILGLDDPRIASGWDGDAAAAARPDAPVDAFASTPDAAWVRCNQGDPACAAGTTCDFHEGIVEDHLCRPVGVVPVGGICARREDCVADSTCYRGVCRSFCTELNGCAAGLEGTCALADEDLHFCDTPCSPLIEQDTVCGPTKVCIPLIGWGTPSHTVCGSRARYGKLGNGLSCKEDTDCKPGFLCDYDSGNLCRPYCDRDATTGCPAGTTCGFASKTYMIEINAYGKRYGVCRP